jgi:hypothetical protein
MVISQAFAAELFRCYARSVLVRCLEMANQDGKQWEPAHAAFGMISSPENGIRQISVCPCVQFCPGTPSQRHDVSRRHSADRHHAFKAGIPDARVPRHIATSA